MDEFVRLPFSDFLDATANRSPAPGGGSVAAATGALACAMARMVVAYSVGKKTEDEKRRRVEDVAQRLARTDALMRSLIQEDAAAYTAMAEAARRAKDDPSLQSEHDSAVISAIRVPLEIAAVASRLLATLDEFKQDASRFLLSDLGVAAVLADATARASDYSIRVNAPHVADVATRGTVIAEADAIMQHCGTHCASIERYAREQLPVG